MALQKTLEHESGLSGNYWKVANVRCYYPTHIILDVNVYKDAAARNADKKPMTVINYNLVGDAYSDYVSATDAKSKNPREQAYIYLKTLSEFEGATDV